MRYRLQRHDGTDCSATMVPITVLRMVPIQRYRQTIYAVTSLFQLINLEMLSKQPTYNIRGNKVMEDKLVLKKEYPILSIISKIAIGISVVGIIAYEWENIVSAFQRLF